MPTLPVSAQENTKDSMVNNSRHPARRRLLWSTLAAIAVTISTLVPAAGAATAAPVVPAAGDEVTAADGATLPVAAVNPPSGSRPMC